VTHPDIRYIATIEARMTSSRLPGKVTMPVGDRPALEVMIERVSKANSLCGVVIATTTNSTDDPLCDLAKRVGVGCFRGSEQDVLGRVLGAAQSQSADVIVELSGDCPLIDPALIDETVAAYVETGANYVSNVALPDQPLSYLPGMDVQVFSTSLLAEVDSLTDDPDDRENVTRYVQVSNPGRFKRHLVSAPVELVLPGQFLTLDIAEDLRLINLVYEHCVVETPDFGIRDIVQFLRDNPDVASINQKSRDHASQGGDIS
jgi:spore coat polysaccharide biosynthesis protein SpsF